MDDMTRRLDAMVRRSFAEIEASVDVRDFRLSLRDGWYTVVFDGSLGQKPAWGYAPGVRFSPEKKGWECRIGTTEFLMPSCPLHEMIFELRPVLLAADLSDADHVLDIGAGNGVFAIYAAARCVEGLVLALEEDPEAAAFLQTIAKVNGLENLQVRAGSHEPSSVLEQADSLADEAEFIRLATGNADARLVESLAAKLSTSGGRMAVLCGDEAESRDLGAWMTEAGLAAASVFGYLPTVLAARGSALPELCSAGESLERMAEVRRKKDFIQEKAEVADGTLSKGHGPKAERPDYPEGSIFLLGIPGCGREALGRALAEKLGLPFVPEADWREVQALLAEQGALVAVVAPGSVREEEARTWLKANGRAFYLMNDVWNILKAQGMDPSSEAYEARRAELAELSGELEPLFMKTVHFPLLGSYGIEELVTDALEKYRF